MAKPKIGIIVGSTRPNRFADKPTEWIEKIARARGDIDVEVLDLRDYPLPFFNEAVSPAWGPSQSEVAQKWQKKVAAGEITEVFACGTAAVITPVSHVKFGDGEFTIADGEPGEVTMALRDTLTGIQRGTFADTHGWMTRLD